MIKSYKDLILWQKAMELVKQTYLLTKSFPGNEVYGLTSQLRRAAVSIPSNIAEGQARGTTGEFRQFLMIARGSLAEVETQLLLAENLQLCGKERTAPVLRLQEETNRLLNALIKSLPTRH